MSSTCECITRMTSNFKRSLMALDLLEQSQEHASGKIRAKR